MKGHWTMASWLIQANDGVAHAYPNDDTITVAACGNELRKRCDNCGRDEEVAIPSIMTARCKRCVDMLAVLR
jgi:hypothetical protein